MIKRVLLMRCLSKGRGERYGKDCDKDNDKEDNNISTHLERLKNSPEESSLKVIYFFLCLAKINITKNEQKIDEEHF